jgi:RNA-directed DNA polymerase
MQTSRPGLAEKAKSQAQDRFRNLYGMLNEERLQDGWRAIRQDAADGVDEVSAQAYERNWDEHISRLVERLKRKRYRAKLVRRHDIPKGDGTLRPVGRPAVEDTLLQLAVPRLLTAIYAQDFLRCSYG